MISYRKQIQTLFLAALVVVAAACSPSPAGSGDDPAGTVEEPPLPIALEKIDWYLQSYGPTGVESELLPGTEITLRLEEGQLSGSAGCNSYFGGYEWSGDSLTVGMLGQTEIWCEPQERMDQEGAYLALLGQVESVRRDGEQVILEGPDGRLLFAETPPAATDATDAPGASIELEGTEWVLTGYGPAGDESEPLPDSTVTLSFQEGQLGGTAGCNRYFGNYQLDGEALTVGALGSTEMWCEGLMDQESAYLALLSQVKSVALENETLVLEGPDGRLAFAQPAPVADQPLAGTVWELETLVTGDAAQSVLAGSRITIEFGEDGRVGGSAGCNSYGSSYTLEGEAVSFDLFAVTLMACPDDALMEQEARYLELLQGATTLVIQGEALTLRSQAGELIFRPATHLALEGVDWVLTGIATEQAVVQSWIDEKITARFEQGRVNGSAGCNTYFADYTAEEGALAIGPAGATRMACEQEIMDREAEFLAALEKVASYQTRLETLSLYDAEGGLLLQFHAAQ